MAISTCSSPRISFSDDLPEENPVQTHQEEAETVKLETANSDFNFCTVTSFPDGIIETCPADELFFNGMIIPTQMRERIIVEEEITSTTTATLVREEKSPSKSFWRFRRSSSLNCDSNSNNRKSSIWSLPLLFRSKSTGSTANNHNHKVASIHSKSVKSSQNNALLLPPHQKGSLRKSSCNVNYNNYNYNYCGRNNPVLNVIPAPYIAKGTSDLLGLAGLFRNGSSKDKKSRK